MIYRNIEETELLKIISQDNLCFVANIRIPYGEGAGLWARKHFIDEQITQALEAGEIKEIPRIPATPTRARFYTQSDYVPGGQIKSMGDGKIYDSKSRYYASLKDQGLHIVDYDRKPKIIDSDITGKDVKNAIEQLKARG